MTPATPTPPRISDHARKLHAELSRKPMPCSVTEAGLLVIGARAREAAFLAESVEASRGATRDQVVKALEDRAYALRQISETWPDMVKQIEQEQAQ